MIKCLLLFLLLPSIALSDELNCDEATTTVEINECVAEKLMLAQIEMRKYLEASLTHYHDDIIVLESIKQAQRTWMKYRELHCDSIYSVWRDGTIRTVMSLGCQINLTQQRTYELWSQYLRTIDETNALLPEPDKS